MIAENGRLLAERAPFDEGMQTAVLDVFRLADERLKTETYFPNPDMRRIT